MYTLTAERGIAFDGGRCIAKGDILSVLREVKSYLDSMKDGSVLIFDEVSSRIVEVDFRGTADEVVERTKGRMDEAGCSEQSERPRRPGRPKLGVVSREITLLPRHWEWLESQPGGASVTLRKLVEDARKRNQGRDRLRERQESVYRFMNAVAGDYIGYEEANRALFARNAERFEECIAPWPEDVRRHTQRLADGVFEGQI